MIFESLEALVKYIISEPINLKYTDITFSDVPKESKKDMDDKVNEDIKVEIKSFFDIPELTGIVNDENILFVESVEGHKNLCGAGKINFMGRELLINLCEFEDKAYIDLDISINGKILSDIKFKLEPTNENVLDTIYIKKELLNE